MVDFPQNVVLDLKWGFGDKIVFPNFFSVWQHFSETKVLFVKSIFGGYPNRHWMPKWQKYLGLND